jgi:predicted Ser/Thr protein kinase
VVTASGIAIGLIGAYFKQDFVKTVGAVAAGFGVAATIGRLIGKYWLAD